MPSTWRVSSIAIYGEYKEMTPDRERYVVTMLVKGWVDSGMNAAQIALRWNSGGATQCSRGVNRHGVSYDSCAHVQKVLTYLER